MLSEEEGLKIMRCNSLISMGLSFKAMKRFKEAVKLLKKALQQAWMINNKKLEMQIYDELG